MRTFITRLERWSWFILLGAFGLGVRIILFKADFAFVEWRSASLFATDILWAVLMVTWFVRSRGRPVHMRPYDWVLVALIAVSLLSLAKATLLVVGVYAVIKLIQGILLFWYVRETAFDSWGTVQSATALVVGGIVQSGILLGQWISQHDVGLRFLGESVLSPAMQGVAVFIGSHGERFMRAYGTFPHPNVAAAYLALTLAALIYLYRTVPDRSRRLEFVFAAAAVLMVWGMLATFSRTVIALTGAAGALWALAQWRSERSARPALKRIAAVLFAGAFVFCAVFWQATWTRAHVRGEEEAVQLRLRFARDAIGSSGVHINWTGAGAGNYVTRLMLWEPNRPRHLYQPVHDLYLLLYAELGWLGVASFGTFLALFIRSAVRSRRREALVLSGAVLLIAVFDHFFWTLNAGQLLFWFTLGVVAFMSNRPGVAALP